jgi:hypothetical protein
MTLETLGLQAASFLISKGIPRGPAVGAACVFWSENNLKTGSQGNQPTEHGGVLNPTGAYGIMSLNGPRQLRLKNYCDRRGLPYDNLEAQLSFFLNEAANFYPKTWQAVVSDITYQEFIPIMVADYENPANHDAETKKSLLFAEELAPLIIKATPPPPAPLPVPPPPVTVPWGGGPNINVTELHDPELVSLESLCNTMGRLAPDQTRRIVAYLASRYVPSS